MPNHVSTRTCSMTGCNAKHYARGWCWDHYRKWWRNGTPEGRQRIPSHVRFEALVDKSGECWEWLGHRNHRGYGRFQVDGHRRVAHRVSYEQYIGQVPDGLQLDHLCGNKGCVNPAHLEAVTGSDNVRRGLARTKAREAAA
jgi:HNH endonuclease